MGWIGATLGWVLLRPAATSDHSFGVVLEDACHQAGPRSAHDAALFNIETFFGWVSSVDAFCSALHNA